MDRYDLIKELNASFNPKKEEKKTYDDVTMTLSIEGKINSNTTSQFMLEERDYKDIATGIKRYLITAKKNIAIGSDIIINEVNGLNKTGRFLAKTILSIKTSIDEPGLKDGMVILTF